MLRNVDLFLLTYFIYLFIISILSSTQGLMLAMQAFYPFEPFHQPGTGFKLIK
jgi:hypothetical protein